MSTVEPKTQLAGLAALSFVRKLLDDMLDTLDDEQMMHQPVAEANHALWIAGHLAVCDDMMRTMLGGGDSVTPEAWADMFRDGTQPQSDAGAYPPVTDLRKALNDARRALLDWFSSMDDAALAGPLPDEWREFAPDYASLMASIAAHEAMHVGQLTVNRKSLGMKPVMM